MILLNIFVVFVVFLFFLMFFNFNKYENFSLLKTGYGSSDSQYLPNKMDIDQVSANNVLSFINNKNCNAKTICNKPDSFYYNDDFNDKICWDYNKDCKNNYDYLKSMCLYRRIHNKNRLCNSIVGVNQRFVNSSNPKKFIHF